MSYRLNNGQTREYKAKFTVDQWFEFRERLKKYIELNILSERDERILTELIVNMKSTEQLAYLARTDEEYSWLKSNQNKPISSRRIHQILTDYFPEFHIQTTNKKQRKDQKIRNEQNVIRQTIITPESCCSHCGSKENLEIHHLMPIIFGGDNNEFDLSILCNDCHKKFTNYIKEWSRTHKVIDI